jgi:SHAQKYF class myb-like DNA-binding protein
MNVKCTSYDENEGNTSRKRFRRSPRESETDNDRFDDAANKFDVKLFDLPFPKNMQGSFASAIFELGLKHASPKILMPLMPHDTTLSTEHIKSHLQKYRIHHQRSKEEFLTFYDSYMQESFNLWEYNRGWDNSNSISRSSSSVKLNRDNRPGNVDNHMNSSSSYVHLSGGNNMNNSNHPSSSSVNTVPVTVEQNVSPPVSKTELLQKAELMIREWRSVYSESLVHREASHI